MEIIKFFDMHISRSYTGGMGLFSRAHVLWLLLCTLICMLLCWAYVRCDRRRLCLRCAAAFLALGTELIRALLLMLAGEYDIGRLPLHLCSMAVYICFFHALHPDRLISQFLYAFCLPGAACALLFPDWSWYPAWHFLSLSSFALHLFIVSYVLMQLVGGDIVPDIGYAPRCLALMLGLAAPVYLFNLVFDTNYMFLSKPAPGSPLEYFAFLGQPWYILGYLPLIALAWLLLYSPYCIKTPPLKKGGRYHFLW